MGVALPAMRLPFPGKVVCIAKVAMVCVAAAAVCAPVASGQMAEQAWLKYASQPHSSADIFSPRIEALGKGALEQSAANELRRGILGLSRPDRILTLHDSGFQIDLATVAVARVAFPTLAIPKEIRAEGFWITNALPGRGKYLIVGADERGVLYGAFELLRRMRGSQQFVTGDKAVRLDIRQSPAMAIRWVDEWDNADGSIERGYAGRSIFFEGGKVRDDLSAAGEYARLLASVGINGCNVNNVNGSSPFITSEMIRGLGRIADAMRPWGVRLAMSVDIASPQKIGGLATYDPLDPAVKKWWAEKVEEIYKAIPDFGGFTVKADSEGQPGPSSFGRTPADAANTLAEALAPHGGVVMYRAFVYNHHLDWNDPKADRARAAYDIFHPLDGKFAGNVIIQTKEGPIDFQAREPVSPLFAGLERTNEAMEVQITQEYTGQQRHLVYLAPMWKGVLDFDMRAGGEAAPVREILAGKTFHRPLGGMIGVAGVGRDAWLGSPLAMANLYAFGRLAWDPTLTAEQIAEEWTRQTISVDEPVVSTVTKMLMASWPAYESYTGTLGLQTLTDITGSHYGPNVESSERNGWGQWHRADHEGVGMDRTVVTGTGFAGQYPPEVAKRYELPATCPDNLLLFFHHVPYRYRLHSAKTVIQSIYDDHYAGAAQAADFVREWDTLKGRIDGALFDNVRARLVYQAGHAIVWRDAIVQYFLKMSGIADERGRAGSFPGRLEAEDARLTGYKAIDVTPWEDASRGKAVACETAADAATKSCAAEWTWTGAAGSYNLAAQYFDLQGGVAQFTMEVNGKAVATWTADAELPSKRPNGDNSTRFTTRVVELKAGDAIRVEGTPEGSDPAALDYVEVLATH